MALWLSTNICASPAIVSIYYDSLSDFDQLRYMVKNADDKNLEVFLNGFNSPYYHTGITDREKAQEFIDSVAYALIPVLPDSENVIWQIIIPRGSDNAQRDEGYLMINYWYPGREAIYFSSYYGNQYENHLAWPKANNPYVFDAPAAEMDGVKIYQYQATNPDTSHYTIEIDGYMLHVIHQDHVKTPEERLEDILKFSFVRLGGEEPEKEEKSPETRDLFAVFIGLFAIFGCTSSLMSRAGWPINTHNTHKPQHEPEKGEYRL